MAQDIGPKFSAEFNTHFVKPKSVRNENHTPEILSTSLIRYAIFDLLAGCSKHRFGGDLSTIHSGIGASQAGVLLQQLHTQ
jgi:hypothetical protein